VLTVLAAAVIISGFAYIPSQTVWLDIFSRCFIEGGSSPFNLVFLGGVVADFVLRRDGDHDRSRSTNGWRSPSLFVQLRNQFGLGLCSTGAD
jgi:hypothetical protein